MTTELTTEASDPGESIARGLAPANLPNHRAERFDGTGFSMKLDHLSHSDVRPVQEIYAFLRGTYDLWIYMEGKPNYPLLVEHLQHVARGSLVSKQSFANMCAGLGYDSQWNKAASEDSQRVLQNVKRGALTTFLGYLNRINESSSPEQIDTCVALARDHAKVMRSALDDVDTWIRQVDMLISVHAVADYCTKWEHVTVHERKKDVSIRCHMRASGFLSARCMENASVDRIVFNLVNNAVAGCSGGDVDLWVLDVEEHLLRWVVRNPVSEQQVRDLHGAGQEDLTHLFTDHGTPDSYALGLVNCANIVAASFGLAGGREAARLGHIGGKVIDGFFYAFFHWPRYVPKPGDPICSCGHV